MFQSQNSKSKIKNTELIASFNKTAEFYFETDSSPIKNKVYDLDYDLDQDHQSDLHSKFNNDLDDSIFRDTNFMQCNIIDLNQINLKTSKLAILKNSSIQNQYQGKGNQNYLQFQENDQYYHSSFPSDQELLNQNLVYKSRIHQNNKWKKQIKQKSGLDLQKNKLKFIKQKAKVSLSVVHKLKNQLFHIKEALNLYFSEGFNNWINVQLLTFKQRRFQHEKLTFQKNKLINSFQEEVYYLKTGNQELKTQNYELKIGIQELKTGNQELKTMNKQFLQKIQEMQNQLKELGKYEQSQAECRQNQNTSLVKQIQSLIHQLNSEQNNYRLLNQEYEQISSELQTIKQKYAFANYQKQNLDKQNHSLRQHLFNLQKNIEQLEQEQFKRECQQKLNIDQASCNYQEELMKQQQEACRKLKQLQDYFILELQKVNLKHRKQLQKVDRIQSHQKQFNRQRVLQQCLQNQKDRYNELSRYTTLKILELEKSIQCLQIKFYQNNQRVIQKQKELQAREQNVQQHIQVTLQIQKKIKTFQKQIYKRQKDVSKKQIDINEKQKDINYKQKYINDKQKDIKAKQKDILLRRQKMQDKEKKIVQKQMNLSIKLEELEYQKNKQKQQEQLSNLNSIYNKSNKKKTKVEKQQTNYTQRSPSNFQYFKDNLQKPTSFFYRSNGQQFDRTNYQNDYLIKKKQIKDQARIEVFHNLSGLNNLNEHNSSLRSDLNMNKSLKLWLSPRYNSPLDQKLMKQKSRYQQKIQKDQDQQRQIKDKNNCKQKNRGLLKKKDRLKQNQIKSQQKLDMIRMNYKSTNMKNIQNKLIKLKKDLQKEIVDMRT